MNTMSSGISVFFIQKLTGAVLVEVEQHAVVGAELLAEHQAVRTLGVVQRQLDLELELARRR